MKTTTTYKENYNNVMKSIDINLIVLFRIFITKFTKRYEE